MATGAKTHFQTFEDLEVYQAAREFRIGMYAVSRWLPDDEKFALGIQIKRAAVSLTNNIAEAHGRYHYRDQVQFVLYSRGSVEELIDDLNVCFDEQYHPIGEVEQLKRSGWRVHNLINGYGRYLRTRKSQQPSILHDLPSASKTSEDDPF